MIFFLDAACHSKIDFIMSFQIRYSDKHDLPSDINTPKSEIRKSFEILKFNSL